MKYRSQLWSLHRAYRELVAEPDEVLGKYGLGRAHHRLLYVAADQPNVTVGDLAAALQVTNQALHKTLKQLLERKMIVLARSERDARVRQVRLTPRGRALEHKVTGIQVAVLSAVEKSAGRKSVSEWLTVLDAIARESQARRGKSDFALPGTARSSAESHPRSKDADSR